MIGVEELERQHLETYKLAILELIRNNTNTLITEDIVSLLKKPPLDSMDLVRNKLVHFSKNCGVILDTEGLNSLLDDYRSKLVDSFSDLLIDRREYFSKIVSDFIPKKQTDIIKIPKKEFALVNRKIKKEAKEKIKSSNQILLSGLPHIFRDDADEDIKIKIIEMMSKYLTNNYNKDLMENIELKIIIKDTTLVNSILEQGERYLFTKNNSHLFDEKSGD